MARSKHKDASIGPYNSVSCINSRRGMARRVKRKSNKRDRQRLGRQDRERILEFIATREEADVVTNRSA